MCSLECRWFIDPTKPKSVDIPWAQCAHCTRWFVHRRGKYCASEDCLADRHQDWLRANRKSAPFTCVGCGKECVPGEDVAWCARKACSRACLRAHQRGTPEYRAQKRIRKAYQKALERGSQGAFTLSEWGARLKQYNRRCAYCQDPKATVEIEHVIPLCRGGSNHIANVVPACRNCNQEKHTLTPAEWLQSGRPRVAGGVAGPHKTPEWPSGAR